MMYFSQYSFTLLLSLRVPLWALSLFIHYVNLSLEFSNYFIRAKWAKCYSSSIPVGIGGWRMSDLSRGLCNIKVYLKPETFLSYAWTIKLLCPSTSLVTVASVRLSYQAQIHLCCRKCINLNGLQQNNLIWTSYTVAKISVEAGILQSLHVEATQNPYSWGKQ